MLTVVALRGMAIAESRLAESLLGGDDGAMLTSSAATSEVARTRRFDPHVALSMHFALTALVCVLMTVIWAGSWFGYFSAGMGVDGVGLPLALHLCHPPRGRLGPAAQGRSVRVHAEVIGGDRGLSHLRLGAFGVAARSLGRSGRRSGFSIPLSIHALVVYRDRLNPARSSASSPSASTS